MGGVGGDALGGVHGDGVAVSDMLAQVVPSKAARAPSSRRRAVIRVFCGVSMAEMCQRLPLRTGSAGGGSSAARRRRRWGRCGGSGSDRPRRGDARGQP